MKTVFFVMLMCVTMVLQAAEPKPVSFSTGGLKIGDPLTEEWAFSHCPAKDKGKHDITGSESIKFDGGEVFVMYQFENHKLIGVVLSFESKLFPILVETYTEKFGSPPHEKKTAAVQTALNARYENEIVSWKTTEGSFTLRKYGDNIRKGFGSSYSPQYEAYMKSKKDQSKESLKSKL